MHKRHPLRTTAAVIGALTVTVLVSNVDSATNTVPSSMTAYDAIATSGPNTTGVIFGVIFGFAADGVTITTATIKLQGNQAAKTVHRALRDRGHRHVHGRHLHHRHTRKHKYHVRRTQQSAAHRRR